MSKKCLLMSPPNIRRLFPRGLVEIASFLESKGVPTEVLPLAYYMNYFDNSKSTKNEAVFEKQITAILEKVIKKVNPIAIGITNQFTMHYPDCLKILEICKKINRKILTVIGGPHVTFQDIDCARLPFIDIVVRGEGEWTMLDLLSAVEKKENLENVKGITFKRDGRVLRMPERSLGNLNELPPINFGLLPYEFVQKSFIYGILNRGCLYNCKFCAEKIFWKNRRHFYTQRLVAEMKILKLKYKTKMRALEDSMLHMGSSQFLELCSELRRDEIDIPHYFYVQSRIDTVSDEGIKILKRTNINRVWLGMESASPKVLKVMNKHTTVNQLIETCEKFRENKIRVYGYWIIGHPGDDPKEAAYSLEVLDYLFSKDLIQRAEFALFLPYPGTSFFDQPKKYGIEILSFDWRKWERWCDKPVSQLKNFSAKDISLFYRKSMDITNAYNRLDRYLQSEKACQEVERRKSDV